MNDAGIFCLLLLIIIAMTVALAVSRHRRAADAQLWSEFASQIGFEHPAIDDSPWLGPVVKFPVAGVYRGRRVSLSERVEWEAGGGHDDYGSTKRTFTDVSVDVTNPRHYQLGIRQRWSLGRLFRVAGKAGTGEIERLDRYFGIRGEPEAFVQAVIQSLGPGSILVSPSSAEPRNTQRNMRWEVILRLQSIQLRGSKVTSVQSGLPTSITGQVAVLNLLCDLAELVETQ